MESRNQSSMCHPPKPSTIPSMCQRQRPFTPQSPKFMLTNISSNQSTPRPSLLTNLWPMPTNLWLMVMHLPLRALLTKLTLPQLTTTDMHPHTTLENTSNSGNFSSAQSSFAQSRSKSKRNVIPERLFSIVHCFTMKD